MPVLEVSDTIIPLSIPELLVESRRLSSSVSSAIPFLFLDLTWSIVENILSHTYVFPNIDIQCEIFQLWNCIFADSFPEALYSLLLHR